MKKLIGVLIVLFSLALFGIVICRIWGIEIVSWQNVLKSGLTLALLAVLIVILIIVYFFFFKSNRTAKSKSGDNIQNRAERL